MWILCTGLWTMLLLAKLCAVLPLSDVSQYLHEMMHMTVFLWVWCAFIRDSGQIWQILLLRALCPSKRQQVAETYSLINYSSETERHFISTSWYSLHLQLASVFVSFVFGQSTTVHFIMFYWLGQSTTVHFIIFVDFLVIFFLDTLTEFDCPGAWWSLAIVLRLDLAWPPSWSLMEFDHPKAWQSLIHP